MARIRVRIDGQARVVAQLELVDRRRKDLSASLDRSGRIALGLARMLVPVDSGALLRSIKYETRNSTLSLIAGGPNPRPHGGGIYAPWVHNGTHGHEKKGPRPYLRRPMEMVRTHARNGMEQELERIIRRAGLSRL